MVMPSHSQQANGHRNTHYSQPIVGPSQEASVAPDTVSQAGAGLGVGESPHLSLWPQPGLTWENPPWAAEHQRKFPARVSADMAGEDVSWGFRGDSVSNPVTVPRSPCSAPTKAALAGRLPQRSRYLSPGRHRSLPSQQAQHNPTSYEVSWRGARSGLRCSGPGLASSDLEGEGEVSHRASEDLKSAPNYDEKSTTTQNFFARICFTEQYFLI